MRVFLLLSVFAVTLAGAAPTIKWPTTALEWLQADSDIVRDGLTSLLAQHGRLHRGATRQRRSLAADAVVVDEVLARIVKLKHIAKEIARTTSAYLSIGNNSFSTLFQSMPSRQQILLYRPPCSSPQPEGNYSLAYDVIATNLMYVDNAMKLIGEIDELVQPLAIAVSFACEACGYVWDGLVFSACLWTNKAALLDLGLNTKTFELAWCSMSLMSMIPYGAAPAYAITSAKRTALALVPHVNDYWFGTERAPNMEIGWGSYWYGEGKTRKSIRVQEDDQCQEEEVKRPPISASRRPIIIVPSGSRKLEKADVTKSGELQITVV